MQHQSEIHRTMRFDVEGFAWELARWFVAIAMTGLRGAKN